MAPKANASTTSTVDTNPNADNAPAVQPETYQADPLKDTGVDLTDAERAKARKDGALEFEKEAGKQARKLLTDGAEPSDTFVKTYPGSDEIMQWSHLIDLGIDAFQKAVAADAVPAIPEEKVAGLLKLERNGKNRTPYVKACCERLGIDDPREVPGAGGHDYTNDVRPITKL